MTKYNYDSSKDQFAKGNRDNKAQELREQGYHVICGREINTMDAIVYFLLAEKYKLKQEEEKK